MVAANVCRAKLIVGKKLICMQSSCDITNSTLAGNQDGASAGSVASRMSGTAHDVEALPESRGDNEADRLQTHVAAAVLGRDGEC
jgi:hypothetical protein